MLNASLPQTTPAVPIGIKKAQQDVAGKMGANPGAPAIPGPSIIQPPPPQPVGTKDKSGKDTPNLPPLKKKFPLKYILGGLVLVLLLVGAGVGVYLTRMKQEIRQQASVTLYPVCCEDEFREQYTSNTSCQAGHVKVSDGACVTDSGNQETISCSNAGDSCETQSCCGALVCQGTAGSKICQDTGENNLDNLCPGGSCTGYTSFQCNSLSVTAGSSGALNCLDNPQNHGTNKSQAVARASATGCGQWDQVCLGGSNAGNLCGDFAIIDNSCGNTGGGGNPTPTPIPTPTPTPSLSPSPSPSPTPTVGCNDACTVSEDCDNIDHICLTAEADTGVCRLKSNPLSEVCEPTAQTTCNDPCSNDGDCTTAGHFCNLDTTTCRLIENPTSQTCESGATPTPSPTPESGCNETCYSASDCTNSSAICYDNLCRLDTNPTDTTCQPKPPQDEEGTYYEQPTLPTTLPESGSNGLMNWLKVGLGALGLGLVFLFL